MPTCRQCNDTGVQETGNNDFPCDCPAGKTALFHQAGVIGPITGTEVRRHFLNGSPEPLHVGRDPLRAEDLPGRKAWREATSVITPAQARERSNVSDASRAFERRVNAAIEKACDTQQWPVRVALSEYSSVAEHVAEKYRKAGWTTEIVRDARDGDFLTLGRP